MERKAKANATVMALELERKREKGLVRAKDLATMVQREMEVAMDQVIPIMVTRETTTMVITIVTREIMAILGTMVITEMKAINRK